MWLGHLAQGEKYFPFQKHVLLTLCIILSSLYFDIWSNSTLLYAIGCSLRISISFHVQNDHPMLILCFSFVPSDVHEYLVLLLQTLDISSSDV